MPVETRVTSNVTKHQGINAEQFHRVSGVFNRLELGQGSFKNFWAHILA